MRRLKTYLPVLGLMLLVLAAVSMYTAMRALSELRPAEDYEDRGVHAFRPHEVYPVQVQSGGTLGGDRRSARTVYKVAYRAVDGSGYKWSREVPARSQGQEIVEAGETVERRVLGIPAEGAYITVEPEETAWSYTEGLRQRETRIVGLAAIYMGGYWILLVLVKLVGRMRRDRAEDLELERAAAPRTVSDVSRFSPEIEEPGRFRFLNGLRSWHKEPGGVEAYRPSRFRSRMWLPLVLLAAVLLLALVRFLGPGAGDPADLDWGWTDNVWSCRELDLRFTLPAGGEICDAEDVQRQREASLEVRHSGGRTVLAAADSLDNSTLSLVVTGNTGPSESAVLEAVQTFARQVSQGGPYTLGEREEMTLGGQTWMAWRIETPERNLEHYYLCRESGAYWLGLVCSGPLTAAPPALLGCFDGENTLAAAPGDAYLPPADAAGLCVFTVPPSLLGNRAPQELVEEWREALESAGPEDLEKSAWTELRDNGDGTVSYLLTPEQYQRMKRSYYVWGTRIWPEMFGMDPGEIVRRISYEGFDGDGIPRGLGVWIDRDAFADGGSFSDFIARFVPVTVIGRYQIMCGVPAGEWGLHVTMRDAETEEVLAELDYAGES